MKRIFQSAMAIAILFAVAACSNSARESANETTAAPESDPQPIEASAQDGPEYTSAYLCPMHCKGSGSDQPGKCPVCGMNYVAKADLNKKEGHSHHGHDHGHGHDH